MPTPDEILAEARKRAESQRLPYDGALMPAEAHELMRQHPKAVLIDVRSRAEWDFIGRIPGAVEVEWKSYPGMKPNEQFEIIRGESPKGQARGRDVHIGRLSGIRLS